MCTLAARGGHLQVLQWTHEHGYPWCENLEGAEINDCVVATGGGHLEVLKWLREPDCP
jgi:cellulase/cellobiase CelA1